MPRPTASEKLLRRSARLAKQLNPFRAARRPVMTYNPLSGAATRKVPDEVRVTVFDYQDGRCDKRTFDAVSEAFPYRDTASVTWINVDGIRRADVQALCTHYGVHPLLMDDILSKGQRAKTDEMGDVVFCLLPMLYYNEVFHAVESEQVSLVLGKHFVISFQEDPSRDVFDTVREKLGDEHSRARAGAADILFYALLDAVVDRYFQVMERMGREVEDLEDLIPRSPNNATLVRINHYRREVTALRRAIAPVRELVNGLLKSESGLIQKKTRNYFKDIYDHILQANETADSYRDLVMNLQDLYMNHVNLRMNGIMKVLAVVTALFAPLSVITGIYGMNFEHMPELHSRYGYVVVLGIMALIFAGMLLIFRKRGWF